MKVDERTLKDVHTVGGGETPPCVGLTSNTLPKAQSTVSAESSQTGVSTRNAHIASKPKAQKEEDFPHWYALRTDRKSTRLNSSHLEQSRMPSSA